MVMRAIVVEGDVVNVVVGGEDGIELADGQAVGIGDTWDGATFTPPPISLANIKAAKINQIERDRDAACVANVAAHGRIWQADARSQALLGQAITLASAGLPLPAYWRDYENSDMAIASLADLLAIAGAIAAQVQVAYAESWARKTVVVAAETVEGVSVA